ncbi:MAG: Wzz/FepE/Etk N-terminal domain-containing protein [Candidatus Krumholzibacteriota bacterium]
MLGIAPDTNVPAKVGGTTLSLRDIVFMLFRRRWVVLAISLPIIIIGGMSLFQQTGSYTAACRVLVELTRVDLPRWNTAGRNIDYDRELSTMFNIAMSLPVADMAASSLEDSLQVFKELLPNRVDIDQPGVLREFLLEKLDVSAVGESNILEFRFSSAQPQVSLMAVGAMRDAFVDYQVHGRRNFNAIDYYSEQLQSVQSQIDSLLNVRSQILSETGYSAIKIQMRNEVGQMADLEGKLLEATANRKALELEHKMLKNYLDGDPLAFPIGLDESKSFTLVHWRNQVSKHQDTLNSILSVHTKDSIPARRQLSIVESSLDRLRQEEIAYVESIRLQLLSTQGREQTLREQVEDLRRANARAPEAESRISFVDVELESLRGLMKNIQRKLGEVRLSQLADERVSPVTSLTYPELVLSLSGGKTVVYFAMIAVFALALGIVVALIMESMDHRVYHPKDVEENLKLPVFASVTRTD